jgi:hypothetical protein
MMPFEWAMLLAVNVYKKPAPGKVNSFPFASSPNIFDKFLQPACWLPIHFINAMDKTQWVAGKAKEPGKDVPRPVLCNHTSAIRVYQPGVWR